MKIVLIGSGNVATVLGKKLQAAGHSILQVAGRNKAMTEALSAALQAKPCLQLDELTKDADVYMVAVSDKALEDVVSQLSLTDQLVVHTAGSLPMDLLKNVSSRYGIFYPYQSINKEVEPLPDITIFVDGNNNETKQLLLMLAKTISTTVGTANDEQRKQYHLCAILVNNFSNYFYAVAEQYCNRHQLDFSKLLPLIKETANRLDRFSPRQVQTGPAIRNDSITIQKHLDLLTDNPSLHELYRQLSKSIQEFPWKG
jgi:predicted short-subunit dehydrogenase-like oxidoreductase (DUF2520 family)